jgi:DNA polymerase-3 subunit gamma/tau
MILKASSEIKNFSKPLAALEMAIIRMSYISDLPTPDEIIKKIEGNNTESSEKKSPNSETNNAIKIVPTVSVKPVQQEKIIEENREFDPKSFEDIIELVRLNKNIRLQYDLENNVSLVSFEKGKIELNILNNDEKILFTLSNKLQEWTNEKWLIVSSSAQGQKTIKEVRDDDKFELHSLIKEHPIYTKAIIEFDTVDITSIEEVPKLSLVSNDKNDKVESK